MAYQCQKNSVIAYIDIWMVPGSLGRSGHGIDEMHSGYEVGKLPIAEKFTAFQTPSG